VPFNVLLLPLLGGYLFVSQLDSLRYRVSRHTGQRLLLDSSVAGVVLLIVARILTGISEALSSGAERVWQEIAPFDYSGTAFVALLLGFVSPWVLNQFMNTTEQGILAMEKEGNYLEVLLSRALRDKKQVSITLSNGKVYIGFVAATFDPAKERKYITLIPTISGYREAETHRFVPTMNYAAVLEVVDDDSPELGHLQRDDFQIVLPISEIQSTNVFDREAFLRFRQLGAVLD